MYLQGTTYGKEAISNFLFSMYNVELANQCSNTSTLVIVDSEYEKSNVTATLPEIDTTLVLDGTKWIHRVYIESDYGEGTIYYEKIDDK